MHVLGVALGVHRGRARELNTPALASLPCSPPQPHQADRRGGTRGGGAASAMSAASSNRSAGSDASDYPGSRQPSPGASSVGDPDSDEYIDLKNYEKNV